MATAKTADLGGRACGVLRGRGRSLAGGIIVLLGTLPAWGATPAEILKFKPVQAGVPYTTPDAERFADCKVELIRGRGKGSGYLLRDPDGKPLRVFFDSNGDNKIDIWSYYRDGVEVYREIDSSYAGNKPDQFRWFNAGGSRWGIDADRDGRIETWKTISAEEVSQEVLAAVFAKDFQRFKAVLLSEADLKSLQLPADMEARVRENLNHAEEKFNETSAKVSALGSQANWIHLETAAPQCTPPAHAGSAELIRHRRATILFEVGGKNDWLQTGEIIQIGSAWRVMEAPTPGATAMDPEVVAKAGREGMALTDNPALAKSVEELTRLDKAFTDKGDTSPAATAAHHLHRADLLEQIVRDAKPEEREPWIRQVADSLSTAAQKGDETALGRLGALVQQLTGAMPGQNLTAYVAFREMQAEYSRKMGSGKGGPEINKTQQDWLERLAKFVSTYPKADDTPDALLQCGMVSEFLNKEVEAKNWYAQLVKGFPEKPQAIKAAGACRRLELEGKAFKLAGPMLRDTGTTFDLDQLAGKVVIVYYWASWNSETVGDFAKLKFILDQAANKVDLVCVNLDGTPAEANDFLQRSPAPGVHLYQPGGLESKLATDYGVMVLPNLFLVGKDGKVVSKNVQMSTLDDEIRKLLK